MEIVQMLEGIPKGYTVPEEYQKEYEKLQLEKRRKATFKQPSAKKEVQESQGESPLGYVGRTAARTGARIGETILGTPGDLLELANSIGQWAFTPEGKEQTPFRESALGRVPLPTSQEIRENVTQKLTGESLEPQSYGEKKYDDVIGLTTGLLLGGPKKLLEGGVKGGLKYLARQGTKALAAETLGTIGEDVLGSKGLGAGLRVGTLLASTLFGGRGMLKNLKEDSYTKASNIAQQEGFSGSVTPLKNSVLKAKNMAKKLDLSKSDKKSLDSLYSYLNKNISQGKELSLSNATDMLKRVNSRFKDVGSEGKKVLSELNTSLNSFIESAGSKSPEFLEAFKTAQELHTAEKAAPEILKQINENVTFKNALNKVKPVSHLAAALTYIFGPGSVGTLAGGLGAALGAKELATLGNLMQKSPRAVNAMKDFLLAGAKQNTPAMLRSFKILDKEAAKYDF